MPPLLDPVFLGHGTWRWCDKKSSATDPFVLETVIYLLRAKEGLRSLFAREAQDTRL
jgi:hypothetical protein